MRRLSSGLLAGIVLLGGTASAEPPSTSPTRGQRPFEIAQAPQEVQWPVEATVLETMSTRRYTYVRVNTEGGDIWAAGPETSVEVGDTVTLSSGFSMANFHSNSLDRTFDLVYLVSAIQVKHHD